MERGNRSAIRPRWSLWRSTVAGSWCPRARPHPGGWHSSRGWRGHRTGQQPVDARHLGRAGYNTPSGPSWDGAGRRCWRAYRNLSNDGTSTLFLQKDAKNTWQAQNDELADSGLADTDGKLPVSFVDWGDNLEVRDVASGQQMVRVETRLMQAVSGMSDVDPAGDATDPAEGMTGYSTVKYGTTTGTDEMWGGSGRSPGTRLDRHGGAAS